MAYVQLPNGSYLEVPKGMQPIQALQEAHSVFPRAFMSEEELSSKQGFMPAAGKAFDEFIASSAEGAGATLGIESLRKYAKDKQKELEEDTNYMPTEEGDVEAARKKGLIPWAGAALAKHVTEPLGGIAGRYGAPIAAGAAASGIAALAAPTAGLTATAAAAAIATNALIGKGATSAADYFAEVGENLAQQRLAKTPEDITSAALYGAGQAALTAWGIPGTGKVMQSAQKYLGPEVEALTKNIVAGTETKAGALAKINSTARNIAQQTAGAAAQGTGLMVGTQAMRRASAGQDVLSPEALGEYGESTLGAIELAPLFGLPHGAFMRRGQTKQIEGAVRERQKVEDREKRAREDVEAAAQANVVDAEKYNEAVQKTFSPAENAAEGVQGRTADMFGGTYAAPEGALPPQRALGDNLLPRERGVEAQTALEKQLADNAQQQKNAATSTADSGFTPFETGRGGKPLEITDAEGNKVSMTDTGALRGQGVMLERQLDATKPKTPQEVMSQESNLREYVKGLRDQVSAAAAKADIKTLSELTPKLKQAEAAYAAVSKEYNALEIPEFKAQRLSDQIANKTKELQKAGGAQGDFAKIEKLTADIQKLQAELEKVKPPSGPDLFGVAKEQRIGEEISKYEGELGARAEEKQRTAEQERKQKEDAERQERQKGLDETFASGTEDIIAKRLAEEASKAAAAKGQNRAEPIDVNALEERNQKLEDLRNKIAEEEYAYKAKETEQKQLSDAYEQSKLEKQTPAQRSALTRKIQKLTDEMGQIQEKLWNLKHEFANETHAAAESRPDVRRNNALEAQKNALGDLHVALQDLAAVRDTNGAGKLTLMPQEGRAEAQRNRAEALTAISKYVDASIKEVNAIRDANKQKPLTHAEAIKLATDIRSWAERAVDSKNPDALKVGKGGVSPMEKQLAEIKSKFHKGESKLQRGPQGLRQEFDKVTGEEGVAGAGERLRALEDKIQSLEGQVNPDKNIIAQLKQAAAKERVLADKERAASETRERQGSKSADESVSTVRTERETQQAERQKEDQAARELKQQQDQLDLFKPSSLKPIATTRATPQNFLRFLRSFVVYKMQDAIAALEKITKRSERIKQTKKSGVPYDYSLGEAIENQKKLAVEVKKAQAAYEELKTDFVGNQEALRDAKRALDALSSPERIKHIDELNNYIAAMSRQTRAGGKEKNRAVVRDNKQGLEEARRTIEEYKKEELEARTAVEKLTNAAAEKANAIEKFHKDYGSYLESSVAIERAVLKRMESRFEKMNEGSPEQRKLKAAIAESRAREAVAEQSSIDANKQRDADARALNDARENLNKLSGFKQETIAGTRPTPNKIANAKYKKLVAQRALEMGKEKPDAKRIQEIDVALAQLETMFEPEARTTKNTIIPGEREVKTTERQQREKADVVARGEGALRQKENRITVADMLKRESELNKQLKNVRTEIAQAIAKKEKLENAVARAKTEKTKAANQAKLDAFVKENGIAELLKREQVLVSGINEVKAVGAKAERALTVLGPKAGRENTTKVPDGPKTTAQAELTQLQKAQDKAIASALDAYEKSQKGNLHENLPGEYVGDSGFGYRISPATEQRLEAGESKRVSDAIEKNLPKDVKVKSVESFADLPQEIKTILARDGFAEGSERAKLVKGFVTPNGEVYIIRGNHATAKELQVTYAHEIIGHAGVDRILGREGMEKLADRIRTQDGGAYELASKLGADVRKNFDGSMADYALTIEEMKRRGEPQAKIDAAIKEMDIKATQELIAYTAELRVDENLRTKAGRWMKEIVGMVRQWLRDHGFAELSKVSTSDIYNIIRQSQRNFNRGELGAFREVSGQVSFRTQKAKFNDSFDSELSKSIQQTVPSQKPWLDRIFGNAMGMTMMHRFEDNFAGLAHMATVNKRLTGSIEGTQMMYFNRLSHNISNMVGEWVTHGPVGIAMTRGNKGEPTAEYQYVNKTEKYKLELAEERANKTPDQAKIVDLEQKIKTGVNGLAPAYEAIGKAAPEIGNTEAAFQAFTYYMAGERVTGLAQREGISFKEALKKLDLGEKLSEADVQRGLQFGRNNKHFQEARKLNKVYNDAQIDFLVETGYLTPAKAAELKKGDFVPFYRERNGEIVDNEYNIRVGDLTTQKHLKELIGGDQPILPFHISSLQNTRMLAEMGMKNIATKNTAYTLNNWGIAEVRPGDGPAAANVIRFYDKGEKKHAILNFKDAYVGIEKKLEEMKKDGKANTPEYKTLREKAEASRENSELFGNIPAELVVRGMEGIALTLPAAVSWLRGPANLLRKGVTRNPLYAVRSLYKESLSSWITTGADVTPLMSSLKAAKQVLGKETPTTLKELQAAGITGGHVYSGTMSDLNTIALQIASGKSGWEKTWAALDRLALRADEAGRVALYDGFVRKGMSQMEAQLATLESQNFTKRGYSPTMSMLSVMIPFFNSQVSGLSTFVRNMSGKSIFEDKLDLQRTAMMRGAMMAGSTLLYTALIQNTKAYKNATEEQKLNNWFVPIPFFEEPLRVAIPFEAGTVFKAVPEAIYNLMATDAKAKDVLPALRDQILQSVPGYSSKFVPQGVKPILEAYTNKDFYSGQDIESKRQLLELPGYRENANTTEAAKAFGKLTGVSPIQLDHAINSYTGGAGIAVLSMLNPVMRSTTPPDLKPSQYAGVGSLFQPVDGAGLINKAFKEAEKIDQINMTFKNLEEKNPEQAIAFANKNLRAVDLKSDSGKFRQKMGEYAKQEREIRAAKMPGNEKRKYLEDIKEEKIEYAKEFMSSVRG